MKNTANVRKSRFRKLLLPIILLFIFQMILGWMIIYNYSLSQNTTLLKSVVERVREDIKFSSDNWDLSRYDADPNLPGTDSLYIFANDGSVIDRWKPLEGYLDTSNFQHLLEYTTPQTISTLINQKWRIYSKPLIAKDQTIGVISVTSSDLNNTTLHDDKSLYSTADFISKAIKISDSGNIDTSSLDIRDIPYNITFQIVDRFNNILLKTNNNNSINRVPDYIDRSYVGSLLSSIGYKIVQDKNSHSFMIYTQPISDTSNSVKGVIVVGKSVQYLDDLIKIFIIYELAFITLAIVFLSILYKLLLKSIITDYVQNATVNKIEIKDIHFDKKNGDVYINENKVHIPYATNQFYLISCLFSSPSKRWETDEILEKFGENIDKNNWRKVYDSMILLNKKFHPYLNNKFIVLNEKTYRINKDYVEIIKNSTKNIKDIFV